MITENLHQVKADNTYLNLPIYTKVPRLQILQAEVTEGTK